MQKRPQPAAADSHDRADLDNDTRTQFEYAWNWFEFHAEQRTKMFNFMLLAIGIFATGIIGNVDKHPIISAVLCFLAAGIAMLFSRLDYRNQELVWYGEDVLIHLEKEKIFSSPASIQNPRRQEPQSIPFGILYRQRQENDRPEPYQPRPTEPFLTDLLRELVSILKNWRSGKHRYLLRGIMYLVAAVFGLTGIGLLIYGLTCL